MQSFERRTVERYRRGFCAHGPGWGSYRAEAMTFTTTLSPHLVQAYRETHYQVHGNPPWVLQVDQWSAALAATYELSGARCCAFLTACNPLSIDLPVEQNEQRQGQLADWLAMKGLTTLPGVGQHPTNGWPGEPSFLVWDLSRADAEALGHVWEQNALVWAGADAIPRLLLLR